MSIISWLKGERDLFIWAEFQTRTDSWTDDIQVPVDTNISYELFTMLVWTLGLLVPVVGGWFICYWLCGFSMVGWI